MMKKTKNWGYVGGIMALSTLSLSSCIKEQLPNIEVDIKTVSTTGTGVLRTTIQENSVTVYVDAQQVDLTNLKLNFDISQGATISPAPESVTDYSQKRQFTVVSEDKAWTKTWNIVVQKAGMPTLLTFDNWYQPEGTLYQIPYEPIEVDGNLKRNDMWATTNNSLSILLAYVYGEDMKKNPSQFYRYFGAQPTEETVDGKGLALKLMTHDISLYDQQKPIVSGCMFNGEFDGTDQNPLLGTHFGMPFNQKPTHFKGYYNYQPQKCLHNGQNDQALIEAVLYKAETDAPWLTGYTIKDKKNAQIVGYAELYPNQNSNGYLAFDIPFTYNQEVNADDLQNWKYSLALYFASSREGDEYKGGGGSVLLIDNVEIVCE